MCYRVLFTEIRRYLLNKCTFNNFSVGLYRGLWPVVSSLCCSNFVYFYAFNGLKSTLLGNARRSDPIKDLTLGFVAGRALFSSNYCKEGRMCVCVLYHFHSPLT